MISRRDFFLLFLLVSQRHDGDVRRGESAAEARECYYTLPLFTKLRYQGDCRAVVYPWVESNFVQQEDVRFHGAWARSEQRIYGGMRPTFRARLASRLRYTTQ
jgi:hypothetical protein